jgi:hypothetical protein
MARLWWRDEDFYAYDVWVLPAFGEQAEAMIEVCPGGRSRL